MTADQDWDEQPDDRNFGGKRKGMTITGNEIVGKACKHSSFVNIKGETLFVAYLLSGEEEEEVPSWVSSCYVVLWIRVGS